MKKITFLVFAMLMSALSWQGMAQIAGESCENPIVVDVLPFDASGNTSTYGNNYEGSDVATISPDAVTNGTGSTFYLGGDDAVFSYTPSSNETLNIETTNDDDWVALWAFSGCPFDSTVGYHTATSGATRAINNLPVLGGTTYYFVISTWAPPQSTDFSINITKIEDCDEASAGTPENDSLMVCAGSSFTISVTGATENASGLESIWQSSPAGENNWTDIEDANSHIHTVADGILEAMDYRFAVTCTISEESDESDIIQVSINPNITECYCEVNLSYVEPITFVGFGDIENTSDASSSEGYEDFTDQSTEVEQGETYEVTLKGNTSGSFTNYFTVFIDWNQNGVLDDEGEIYEIGSIQNSSGTDDISLLGDIEVPADAVSGNTRMRVIKNYNSSRTNPCGSITYGQVEDYTVFVAEGSEDTFPSPYCDITDATDVIVEEITKIVFDETTITNDDSDAVLINKTDTVVNVIAGDTYNITVEGFTDGEFDSNIVAFIDWNQNDILDDVGEIYELGTLSNSTGSDGISVSMDIAVPADAVLGNTRIRITKTYFDEVSDAIINPCGIEFDPFGMGIYPGYGQALDFTLNIEESSGGNEGEYCIPVLDCTDGDNITNVTFLEIDNTTTCSPNGYGDFTNMVATVGPGNEYPISVTVGDGWNVESVSVWIDFNNNGIFEEEEFFFIGTGSDETLTSAIAIPNDATNGDYRMRVRVAAIPEDSATWDKSCDSEDGYGETEDYTITVDETLNINDFAVSNFKYYPNPMTDILHISSNEEAKSVSAFNMLGQEVLSNKHFANGKVDATTLPTGTYLFRVTFDNGHIETFKVIKNK